MVETTCAMPLCEAFVRPAGVKGHITRKRIASEAAISGQPGC